MQKFRLQLQDIDGNVEEQKELILRENDTLIIQFDENTTLQQAQTIFQMFERAVEDGGFIGIPKGIEISILKVREE